MFPGLERKHCEKVQESETNDDDVLKPEEEEMIARRFQIKTDYRPSFQEMQADDPTRRPSTAVYQSVDENHPDLQRRGSNETKPDYGIVRQ